MSEETSWIQDVWSYNLESEMKILRELVERYPYISMVSFYYTFFFYFLLHIFYIFILQFQRKKKENK